MERSLSLILIVSILLCSCTDNLDTPSRVTGEILEFSEIELSEATSSGGGQQNDGFTDFRKEDNLIVAHYDDSTYYIDYDLSFYDYQINRVSIFSADYGGSFSDDLYDGLIGYDNVIISPLHMKNMISYASRDVYESFLNTINSIAVESKENPDFDYFDKDLFPYVLSYNYDVSNILDQDVIEEITFDETSYPNVTNYLECTYRHQLGGLPLGVPAINQKNYIRCNYNDYSGSIYGVFEIINSGNYDARSNIYYDVIDYNLTNIEIIEDDICIVPLAECIQNSIEGITKLEQVYVCNSARVYFSELLYIPFSEGCEGISDFDFDVKIVPVWALYFFIGHDGQTLMTATVFLNATNGELI